MLAHLRILDTDGSVDAGALHDAAEWASVVNVDLRDIGPSLRLWSRAGAIRTARQRIARAPDPHPSINFLGSGDYHHLAALLIERVQQPVSVLHIDNHPDWVRLAPRWHCGSWINRVLEFPNVQRVVTAGPCSDDLANPARKGGNLAALGTGRLALFPWQHAPSRVRRRIADGPGHTWRDGTVHWRNLAERPLRDACSDVIAALPTEAVWITLDKDVLPEQDAITNWDQGWMPLDAVRALIHAVGTHKRILGADICGEYSPPAHRNLFKRIESSMDQPLRAHVDAAELARNAQVNRALAVSLFTACSRGLLP